MQLEDSKINLKRAEDQILSYSQIIVDQEIALQNNPHRIEGITQQDLEKCKEWLKSTPNDLPKLVQKLQA